MNLLDRIYPRTSGPGLTKVAEAGTVDLTQISAAEYLQAVAEQGDGGGGLDLENMSAEDLVSLLNQTEEEKTAEAEAAVYQQMIEDGSFAVHDAAGRIQARAMWEELQKVASGEEDDGELFSLEGLTGAQLQDAIESGEFELVELEKDAGLRSAANSVATYLKGLPVGAKLSAHAAGRAGREAAGRAGRTAAQPWKDAGRYASLMRDNGASRSRAAGEGARAFLGTKSGKAQAAIGAGAAGGGAAFALRKKKKK
jgi:hypothetical protein